MLTNMPKYVASTTLEVPLPWANSTRLIGDFASAVTDLKASQSGDILIMGSGNLIASLMTQNLIDEYELLIHPLVLGMGRRLFSEDGPSIKLELVDTTTTSTQVSVATYRPIAPTP